MEQSSTLFLYVQAGANIGTALASIATIVLAGAVFKQIILAKRQSKATEDTLTMQAIVNIVEYLQREEVRKSRRILMELHKSNKPYLGWSTEEKLAAELACATYDTVGIMLKGKFVPDNVRQTVIEEWRDSITRCNIAAQEMLVQYRMERGEKFWSSFDWLAERALKRD